MYTESDKEPFGLVFEFDEAKSHANREKHGIDFVDAQELWLDANLVQAATGGDAELRFVLVGRIRGTHWSAVVTYRGEAVRLISVRRARAREVQIYEGD